MNVSIAHPHQASGLLPAIQAPHLSEISSEQKASEHPVRTHGVDQHVSSAPIQKHGLSPLKVVGLHSAIMAVEHGVHFSLHKAVHYAESSALQTVPSKNAATLHTLGDVAGAAAAGYLAYRAIEHALHASASGHTESAAAYTLSATLDAGLAVANTLAVFKQVPSVSIGVSLSVGLLSTASSALGAKLEQTKAASH